MFQQKSCLATFLAFSLCSVSYGLSSGTTGAQQAVFDASPATLTVPQRLNDTITQLTGWHARAIDNPYPSPHLFNWTISKNQFDIFAGSSSLGDPNRFTVAFLRDNDNRSVVVDSMGRILLPREEDYAGMVELASYIVGREFYDGEFEEEHDDDDDLDEEEVGLSVEPKPLVKKTHQSWTIDWGGATCQRGDYWRIRVPVTPGEEEWRGHSVSGFDLGENARRRLERPVNGHTDLPLVLHQFMALTYDGDEWLALAEWQRDNVRKVMKAFRGYW
ncbi:hypothetical protein PQX77_016335 [Marasmius sp. AFHP31]|nr:hypothetical protein PQX77_016335 [Marasmius sp. AFHP31]